MRTRGGRTSSAPGFTFDRQPVAYSHMIEEVVAGLPRRGIVHSVFGAAANVLFPAGFMLSLNARSAPRMPNGLQLSAGAGAYPFSELRVGMHVLLGAQRLHIEAIGCSLDLSSCDRWDPCIQHPEHLNMEVVRQNGTRLAALLTGEAAAHEGGMVKGIDAEDEGWRRALKLETMFDIARYLCGRGVGLTPTGENM